MIELPDFNKSWDYENGFYLTCDNARLNKPLAHYEIFKKTAALSGAIVECGLFKGASFVRFAAYRELLGSSNQLIGFDTFGEFPETHFDGDAQFRKKWIAEAGEQSISKEQLQSVLKKKGVWNNIELVEGDVNETIPKYVEAHPDLKISLLNLDTDIYEPAVTILKYFWSRMVTGGVLILDDYTTVYGETKAVDEYFKDTGLQIEKPLFPHTPHFIVK